ncbi:hypothetical protein [Streptomyces collinus]|uniref:Lipoprotein n=1 Tax=Streptomyces collinus (strain DSM 40733 / Tue 365) TaxID=1214242 RepID=S5V5U4_STRC3|nr:hypothetical protein [Streptomyces collinus]AGS73066.1 lipoprotein [Streptomyces collinus Tu 365]UJA11730.1 hypothetical protein HGI10_57110 [Streptomyces collinus]UJA13404.1 hypothetical protein HGI09_06990 [Streptomyces collinus]
MPKTKAASAVTALVLAAALTGCGSEDGPGPDGDVRGAATPPARAVQNAYRATLAARTARMTVTSKVVAEGQTLTGHGSGVADLEHGASRFDLTSQGTTIEQRVVDGAVYQKPTGARRGAVPGGRTWLKIDLARLGGTGPAGRSRPTDPMEPVRYLKDAGRAHVTRVGGQTLDGTRTTHYRVAVPVSVLARGDAGQEQELRRQLGTDRLPVEVWLDGRGRLRQERVLLTLHPLKQRTPGHGNTRVTSTTEVRLTDFGTEVKVTAPPAADTADVTGRATGSAGTAQAG